MDHPVLRLLQRLEGVRRTSGGWTARCPSHEDRHASLAIAEGDDHVALVHCHAGCATETVVAAVGLAMSDLFSSKDDKPRRPDPRSGSQASPPVKGVTPLRSADLTVEELSASKRLDPAILAARSVRDIRRNGVRMLEIPYRDTGGSVVSMRYRDGVGFRWRGGDRVMLYGLERLAAIRQAGWVLLVEGESDTWTADTHGLPVLGIPGKTNWRPEWRSHLEALAVVLWQEPGAGDLTERVGRDVPDARVILAPEGIKDISEAHIAGRDVAALVGELRGSAPTAAELVARQSADEAEAALPEIEARASTVLGSRDPLELVETAVHAGGYGGDVRPVLVVYLAATTRLLRARQGATPTHVLLVGPPSAGKSYTLSAALALLPAEATHSMEAGSPRTLIYDDADLVHRVVVFPEADSLPAGEDNPAASAVRALLSEGRLAYKVTVRDPESGDFAVRVIEKAGPTVLLTTAVRRLGPQLDSRLFVLEVPDEQEQLRAALRTQAALELAGAPERTATDALQAYQELLRVGAPWDVIVPFVARLAEAIGRNPLGPRIMRDFARLISLTKAVTVLRHRQRSVDAQGRLIAELADYGFVRALVADIYAGSQSGASARVRATVAAVAGIVAETGGTASVTAVSARMGINKMAASRRVSAAVKGGYLVNAEDRPGHPASLMAGEALPAADGLPMEDELERNGVTALTGGYDRKSVATEADRGGDRSADGREGAGPALGSDQLGWLFDLGTTA